MTAKTRFGPVYLHQFTQGQGRTRITFSLQELGPDLLVFIHNQNAHIGAIALGEYINQGIKPSVKLIARTGHREDDIVQRAARELCNVLRRSVSVIAGIHLDDITQNEINDILLNAASGIKEVLLYLGKH
jgi:hypothetical protein